MKNNHHRIALLTPIRQGSQHGIPGPWGHHRDSLGSQVSSVTPHAPRPVWNNVSMRACPTGVLSDFRFLLRLNIKESLMGEKLMGEKQTRSSIHPTPPHPTPAFPFNVMAFPFNVMAFPVTGRSHGQVAMRAKKVARDPHTGPPRASATFWSQASLIHGNAQ